MYESLMIAIYISHAFKFILSHPFAFVYFISRTKKGKIA